MLEHGTLCGIRVVGTDGVDDLPVVHDGLRQQIIAVQRTKKSNR